MLSTQGRQLLLSKPVVQRYVERCHDAQGAGRRIAAARTTVEHRIEDDLAGRVNPYWFYLIFRLIAQVPARAQLKWRSLDASSHL